MTTNVQVNAPAPAAPTPAAPTPPAPAPAAPVVPDVGTVPAPASFAAPTPAAPAPTPAAPSTISYEPTGHAGLDLALSFVGNLGIGPEDAAIKAAEGGDFALLEARLATLGDKAKGWEQVLAVGKSDFARLQEANKTAATAAEAKLAEAVGGEQQWGAVKAWASAKAEPAEKTAINAALAAGGIAAKAVALYLNQLYQADPSVTVPAQRQAVNTNAGNSQPDSGALSPRAYVAAVQALRATVRGAIEDSPQYAQLQQRRAMWRG